ncbi:hypothetical protein N7468_002102 [Penicillium chermesinum]|uniref:Uncharacterized protein n=1 Tax=Penicillium chermesinum TaxID=63820 RepID=A0A9W9TZ97_9EURO|nr:uncharacterized protein N7468_002102 [Penicillium chermesinum]KAJ5247119.1 hypothetical protein N7468_002102 [Penicillium chermesinum]
MPAPIAKGILVTVSVLVAAGVAVYNSPQFQEWLSNSRRKLAVALHNLGDEIHPSDSHREDISMTEEESEAAEERRRLARAEIMRRAEVLESLRGARNSSRPLDSFDTLVDKDGNLLSAKDVEAEIDDVIASSTAVDTGAQQPTRRGISKDTPQGSSIGDSGLLLDLSSDTVSHHPSESDVQFTPTSETPGEALFDPFSGTPVGARSPVSDSSHTEGHADYYYSHPFPVSNQTEQSDFMSGISGLDIGDQAQHEISSASSIAGSSNQAREPVDAFSDGGLSDFDVHSIDDLHTPASWSEVGSVISDHDAGHQ